MQKFYCNFWQLLILKLRQFITCSFTVESEQIMKLLEKESIKWEEGETTGTILISLDKIDRKNLSFLKK